MTLTFLQYFPLRDVLFESITALSVMFLVFFSVCSYRGCYSCDVAEWDVNLSGSVSKVY